MTEDQHAFHELTKLVGPDCAESVLTRCGLFGLVKAAPPRPELDGTLLKLRPRSAVRGDLEKTATLASQLADMLYPHDTESQIVGAWSRQDRAGPPSLKSRGTAREAIKGLSVNLRKLSLAASEAARKVGASRGAAPDLLRQSFLTSLGTCLAMYGHPLAAAENAKLVRVARIVWPLVGFDGDPRDSLRRMVKAGTLKPEEIAKKLKECQGLAPAEVNARDLAVSLAGDFLALFGAIGPPGTQGGAMVPKDSDSAPGGVTGPKKAGPAP